MTAIAQEIDRKLQTVKGPTAERLERLVREALALADVATTDEEAERGRRVDAARCCA